MNFQNVFWYVQIVIEKYIIWWVSIVVSTQGFQPCREGFKSPTHYKIVYVA